MSLGTNRRGYRKGILALFIYYYNRNERNVALQPKNRDRSDGGREGTLTTGGNGQFGEEENMTANDG